MFKLNRNKNNLEVERLLKNDIVYSVGLNAEKIIPLIRKHFVKEDDQHLIECSVTSIEDYERVYRQMLSYRTYELLLNDIYGEMPPGELAYPGRCEVCDEEHKFIVNLNNTDATNKETKIPNWRESLICPSCSCNNRMRFMISKVKREYRPGMNVLMYEAGTLFFNRIKLFIPDATGCISANQAYNSRQIIEGERYEDFEKLSFEQGQFQLVIINDIFGFMKNYRQLLSEVGRIISEDGKLIMTVPFNPLSQKTVECEGAHDGILCQIFGWDMMEILKNFGFKNVYGKVYYSISEGYLGYLPIYFEAIKGES